MPVPVIPSDEPDPEDDGAPDVDRPNLPLRLPPGGSPTPG